LLTAAGVRVFTESAERAKVPALMISKATQALMIDVFERPDLFRGLPQIDKRVVAWGKDAKTVVLPHSAVIISEQELSDRLRPQELPPAQHDETQWRILASRPLPASSLDHRFGSRIAGALLVELKASCDAGACWVESFEHGWLFLIPISPETGWLLSVGEKPEALLDRSHVVGEQIEASTRAGGEFPAYPRIADPVCGEGWLACGTAAMAFDPLCGDGTGHAVREAILAAAVIRALANGASAGDVLEHYRTRLHAGFKRHLELCREFYSAGHRGAWWEAELHAIMVGMEWCKAQLGTEPKFQYRLNGFELQPISHAAVWK
jgi:hypothetical protein